MLSSVLAFDRGIRMRGAQRVVEIPGGVVVRHDELPSLYHLNAVLLGSLRGDAARLARLADEHLGDLGHRHIVIDDADAAERVAPQLLASGWTRQRVVFMRFEREPDRPAHDGLAGEIHGERARELQLALLSEEAPRDAPAGTVASALAKLLVAGQEAVRAGTRSICFAAGDGGRPSSMCTLFIDGEMAMIDEVGTMRAARGRGLARAVVSAALKSARAEGCATIVIPADADDWPQLMYAGLGFEPLGRQVSFTRV